MTEYMAARKTINCQSIVWEWLIMKLEHSNALGVEQKHLSQILKD